MTHFQKEFQELEIISLSFAVKILVPNILTLKVQRFYPYD